MTDVIGKSVGEPPDLHIGIYRHYLLLIDLGEAGCASKNGKENEYD